MPLKIKSTSGSVTLSAENTAGDQTLTIPSLAGGKTLLTTDGDGSSLTGISHSDATKLPLSGGTVTGDLVVGSPTVVAQGGGRLIAGGGSEFSLGYNDKTSDIHINNTNATAGVGAYGGALTFGSTSEGYAAAGIAAIQTATDHNQMGLSFFTHPNTAGSQPIVEKLQITHDGRGLSQFTAKAWVNFNGSGTLSVRDSHGVSSVSDLGGTGQYQVNFSNNMANTNYSAVTGGIKGSYGAGNRINDMTTSKFAIDNWSTSGYLDATIVTAIVFGD